MLEKKGVKNSTLHFSWLAQGEGKFLIKTATYLNYCRMLCACFIERVALFQVGTYKPKNLRASKYKVHLMLNTSVC